MTIKAIKDWLFPAAKHIVETAKRLEQVTERLEHAAERNEQAVDHLQETLEHDPIKDLVGALRQRRQRHDSITRIKRQLDEDS